VDGQRADQERFELHPKPACQSVTGSGVLALVYAVGTVWLSYQFSGGPLVDLLGIAFLAYGVLAVVCGPRVGVTIDDNEVTVSVFVKVRRVPRANVAEFYMAPGPRLRYGLWLRRTDGPPLKVPAGLSQDGNARQLDLLNAELARRAPARP
jgi:hypothetical protein